MERMHLIVSSPKSTKRDAQRAAGQFDARIWPGEFERHSEHYSRYWRRWVHWFARGTAFDSSGYRVVNMSTDEVYGAIAHGSFTEAVNYAPNSPYAASKAAGDHFTRAYPVII